MALINEIVYPNVPDQDQDEQSGAMELKEIVDMNALRIVRDNFEEVYKRMGSEFWKFNSKTQKYETTDYDTAYTIINDYYLKKKQTPIIKYKYSAKSTSGRRFADGTSLQGLAKPIRHTIAHKMVDIDMKNAHPTFLDHLCKTMSFNHPILQKYITKREECLQSWIGTNIGKTTITTTDQAKEYFLKVLNGGGNETSNKELKQFYNTHKAFLDKFYHNKEYAKYRKIADNAYARDKNVNKWDNRKGSTLNHYLCDVENRALIKIERYLQDKNIEYGALCFDGIMINPVPDVPALLKELNKMLLEQMGFSIIMAEKKMTEAIDISDLNVKEDIDTSDEGLVKYFLKDQKDNMKYSTKQKQLYVYDNNTALWKVRDFDYLRTLFTSVLILYVNTSPDPKQIEEVSRDLKEDKKLSALLRTITPYIKAFDDDTFILNNFDNNPGYIPLQGAKIIELSTGKVRERVKEDYFTKSTDSNIVEVSPEDRAFILNYFSSLLKTTDNAYRDCFIGDIAYSITGENNQKALICLLGERDGGKSLLLEIISNMINGFSSPINKRLILHQKNASCHDSEMFSLIGNRLGTVSELSDKERYNETLLKAITGKDTINIRGAGQHSTVNVLLPTVMWIATNNKPKYTDDAFASRLRYYDFCNTFDRDDAYAINIKSKTDKIFSLVCEYAKRFYENGKKLMTCQQVMAFSSKQNIESNPIHQWIVNEWFQPGTNKEWIEKAPLYEEYKQACIENKEWVSVGKINFFKEFEKVLKLKAVEIKFTRDNIQQRVMGYRELKREPGEEDDVKEE
jgi:hypothetical protein